MRRIVAVTGSATYPPRRGNQVRSTELYRALAQRFRVDSYSLTIQRSDLPLAPRAVVVSPTWTDHRLRDPLLLAWTAGMGRLGYPPVFAHRLLGIAPRRGLRAALAAADVVIVSPSYHFDWVRAHIPAATPVVYDQHSVETDMYPARTSAWSRVMAREVARAERSAVTGADLVMVTCDPDRATARAWGARRSVVVANGVDVARFHPPSAGERDLARREIGVPDGGRLAVFVGSGHPPNVAAVAALEAEAPAFAAAGIGLLVAGRCGLGRAHVEGVTYAGEVADVAAVLHAADIVLCPLTLGSGTSVKTIEYLASGIPLVSTAFGVRGLGLRAGEHYREAQVGGFASASAAALEDPDGSARMAAAARRLAETSFSWESAGEAALAALESLPAQTSER